MILNGSVVSSGVLNLQVWLPRSDLHANPSSLFWEVIWQCSECLGFVPV